MSLIVHPRPTRTLSINKTELDCLGILAVEGTRIIAYLDPRQRPAAYFDRPAEPNFYRTIPHPVVSQFKALGLISEEGGDYRGRFLVLTDKGRREAGAAQARRR